MGRRKTAIYLWKRLFLISVCIFLFGCIPTAQELLSDLVDTPSETPTVLPDTREPQDSKNQGTGSVMRQNDVCGAAYAPRSLVANEKSAVEKTQRRLQGINRHPMACPESFPKDGVYIWCDPDGVWTILWRGKSTFAFEGKVTCERDIMVENTAGHTTHCEHVLSNELNIVGSSKMPGGLIQFASENDSVGFDISIDGGHGTSQIYIGSRLVNPLDMPFCLNQRPLPRSPHVSAGVADSRAPWSFSEVVQQSDGPDYQQLFPSLGSGGDGAGAGHEAEQ
jgi:hypothetical protein